MTRIENQLVYLVYCGSVLRINIYRLISEFLGSLNHRFAQTLAGPSPRPSAKDENTHCRNGGVKS